VSGDSPEGDTPRVTDNPDERRYEVWVGDRLAGKAEYRRAGDRVIFFHTEIGQDFAGGGIGSHLARQALDDVRRRGLRVTPKCPFIAAYIRRHPEYQELVSEPSSRPAPDA
jgi:predicted GNAT family acetyltransferase